MDTNEINADYIELGFYDCDQTRGFSVNFHRGLGWSLFRDLEKVVVNVTWEESWAAMTTGERVRCAVFANSLR